MRFQLASDLHLEHIERSFAGERLISPAADADVLVLAGDIANGSRAVELFADWPVPVLYVPGNHESYERVVDITVDDLRAEAQGTSVRVLDQEVIELEDLHPAQPGRAERASGLPQLAQMTRPQQQQQQLRILGCTLWTDYRLGGGTQAEAMASCERLLADHRLIRTLTGPFTADHALRLHLRSRAWLERELSRPFDGTTVVITHHAPHPGSVHARYVGNPVNAGFVSDLSELLPSVDLWLHGHVHDSFDYRVHGCRVVANPRGYARNRRVATTVSELLFENEAFDPDRVVDTANLPE